MKSAITIAFMLISLVGFSQQKTDKVDITQWDKKSTVVEYHPITVYDPVDIDKAIQQIICICIIPHHYLTNVPTDMMVRHYFAISYWD